MTQTAEGKILFSLWAWGGKGSFPNFEFSRAEALDLLEALALALGYTVIRAYRSPDPVVKIEGLAVSVGDGPISYKTTTTRESGAREVKAGKARRA